MRTLITVSTTSLFMEVVKERKAGRGFGKWMKVAVDVDVCLIHDCRIISCDERKVTICT